MPDLVLLLHLLFWVSVAVSIVSALAAPVVLLRLPADYFVRPDPPRKSPSRLVFLPMVTRVARNCLAAVLFVAGLVMLVTPGQGLLMLLVALWVARFPGKRRLERWLISFPRVLIAINRIRVKAGAPPLQAPQVTKG